VEFAGDITGLIVTAATEGGEEGGSFLVQPGLGLMIWTLIAFLISFYILKRAAYPRIQEALEKRANMVAESIDAAKRTREEADQLLQEYRERLREAREQADDIVHRARQSSERFAEESKTEAKHQREEMMEQTRRDIEQETRRALGEIRREVADLTIAATEKVMRKSLDGEDQKRLVEEALQEVDFSALSGENGKG
jgi:F-type H+-transporting ATPase subunit b